jgi:DNA-binding transcriptional regulator YhcF (GntR family)
MPNKFKATRKKSQKIINQKLANEKAIVQAIKKWYRSRKYGPSYRDLSEMTEMSLGTVYNVCQELRTVGILQFEDNVARTIKLKEIK